MEFATWKIASLPPAACLANRPEKVARLMKPVGTHAFPRDDEQGLWCGQTTWAWEDGGMFMAVGWDWVEIQKDVVTLADPMTMISNVHFEESGLECDDRRRILILNSIVYLLPWQRHICGSLGRLGPKAVKSLVVPKRRTRMPGAELAIAA